jgi:hypothetical protein
VGRKAIAKAATIMAAEMAPKMRCVGRLTDR